MEKEFEMFNQIQDVIRNAANTIEKLIEAKKERDKVKRDWEIVSFKSHGLIYNLMDWRKYRCYTQPTFAAPGHEVSQEWALQQPEFSIHSVRRLSDNSVWAVGEDTPDGKIKSFEKYNEYHIKVNLVGNKYLWFHTLCKLPQRTKKCNICGGKLVLIRGRYPNSDKREVCPTCATERLEQINELSSNAYGVAMKESSIPPLKP